MGNIRLLALRIYSHCDSCIYSTPLRDIGACILLKSSLTSIFFRMFLYKVFCKRKGVKLGGLW